MIVESGLILIRDLNLHRWGVIPQLTLSTAVVLYMVVLQRVWAREFDFWGCVLETHLGIYDGWFGNSFLPSCLVEKVAVMGLVKNFDALGCILGFFYVNIRNFGSSWLNQQLDFAGSRSILLRAHAFKRIFFLQALHLMAHHSVNSAGRWTVFKLYIYSFLSFLQSIRLLVSEFCLLR